MTTPGEMSTITSVLAVLHEKGYDTELMMTKEGLATGKGKIYRQEDLTIIKTYRFEGASDPAEEVIIYLMAAKDGFVGYSMDAYGAYSNHSEDGYSSLIRRMVMSNRNEQQVYQ